MISAIVYTSNSGYTAEYARMLGELTGLPVNDLRQVHNPQPQREVIFLGWIMADNVMGYAKASRFYKVRCVSGGHGAGHAGRVGQAAAEAEAGAGGAGVHPAGRL